jgi:hypothetical protein
MCIIANFFWDEYGNIARIKELKNQDISIPHTSFFWLTPQFFGLTAHFLGLLHMRLDSLAREY